MAGGEENLPYAGEASFRRRHYLLIVSFVVMVLVPTLVVTFYLTFRAADQYVSSVGFSVRTESAPTSIDLLGGLSSLAKGGATDTDILYEFIQSQKLVELVDARLDLRKMYTRPKGDPVFTFDNSGSIEDLVDYWGRMVKIYYDSATSMLELNILAFDPNDAQNIAKAIFEESNTMINKLSAVAQADATRYARDELDKAVGRLKTVRRDITAFRNRTQIVDPSADIQGQMSLVNSLQEQLASTMIEYDLLRETTRETDPRLEQATRKIAVIEARIGEERKKFGVASGSDTAAFSEIISEYEGLSVELDFAQRAYVAALTSYDLALSNAQRQSRYLAAYVEPTLAQKSTYPKSTMIGALTFLFLLLSWSIIVLLGYAVKDRR